MKLNKIIQSYKNSNMNKDLLSHKLKKYYSPSKVIATGGLSLIFKNNIKSIDLIEQNLTINGLAYFYLSQEKDI